MSDDPEATFDLLVEEAVSRIDDGIADNADEAVVQLIDEGLCTPHEVDPLRGALRMQGYPVGPKEVGA